MCVFFTFLVFSLLYSNYSLGYYLSKHNKMVLNDSKKEEQESLVSQLLPYHVNLLKFDLFIYYKGI